MQHTEVFGQQAVVVYATYCSIWSTGCSGLCNILKYLVNRLQWSMQHTAVFGQQAAVVYVTYCNMWCNRLQWSMQHTAVFVATGMQ